LSNKIGELYLDFSPLQILDFIKLLGNSGVWVSKTYLKYFMNILDVEKSESIDDIDHNFIIEAVKSERELDLSKFSYGKIFKSIYREIDRCDRNHLEPTLSIKNNNFTIVLVSGMFNEIFSTAAFERGVKQLQDDYGIEYLVPKVNGIKSTTYNSEQLYKQLNEFLNKKPGHKLWLFAYSKGGIDCLHMIRNHQEFADKNIIGLSTVAAPILGTNHLEANLIKLLNKIHHLKDTKIYQAIEAKQDILAKEFQKSISSEYQKPWFENNHSELPKSLFYTALALESEWHESHIWMILTKLVLPSEKINDGVVDSENALFPDYFEAYNLGIIKGHHLIGVRSSYYNQEALIKAHVVYLSYFKKLD